MSVTSIYTTNKSISREGHKDTVTSNEDDDDDSDVSIVFENISDMKREESFETKAYTSIRRDDTYNNASNDLMAINTSPNPHNTTSNYAGAYVQESFSSAYDTATDKKEGTNVQASFYNAYDTLSECGEEEGSLFMVSENHSETLSTRCSRLGSFSPDYEWISDDGEVDSMDEMDPKPEGLHVKCVVPDQHVFQGKVVSEKSGPRRGEMVFVNVEGSPWWERGRVEQCIRAKDQPVKYKVKVHSGEAVVVMGRCLAYWKPVPQILPTGCRVIASPENPHEGQNDKFCSGVILESPSDGNKYCYLVYFDKGAVLHVHWKRVRLVCDGLNNVADDKNRKSDRENHKVRSEDEAETESDVRPVEEDVRGRSSSVDVVKPENNTVLTTSTSSEEKREKAVEDLIPPDSAPLVLKGDTQERKFTPPELKLTSPEPASVQLKPALLEPQFPPMSQIPPRQGEKVFVKVSGSNSWKCGQVEEMITKSDQSVKYVVQVHHADTVVVTGRSLAYWDPLPSMICLPIGSRVIANQDCANCDDQCEFSSGLILETPKPENQDRYLVFFDRGGAHYVELRRIRLVCESSKNFWDDVDEEYRDFIQSYFEKGHHGLWAVEPGDTVKAKKSDQWSKGVVVQVDCSTAKVKLEDGRTEWFIRDGKLLAPIVEAPIDAGNKSYVGGTSATVAPNDTTTGNTTDRSDTKDHNRRSSTDMCIIYVVMSPTSTGGNAITSANTTAPPATPDTTYNLDTTIGKVISSIPHPNAFPFNNPSNNIAVPCTALPAANIPPPFATPAIPQYSTASDNNAPTPDSTDIKPVAYASNNIATVPQPNATINTSAVPCVTSANNSTAISQYFTPSNNTSTITFSTPDHHVAPNSTPAITYATTTNNTISYITDTSDTNAANKPTVTPTANAIIKTTVAPPSFTASNCFSPATGIKKSHAISPLWGIRMSTRFPPPTSSKKTTEVPIPKMKTTGKFSIAEAALQKIYNPYMSATKNSKAICTSKDTRFIPYSVAQKRPYRCSTADSTPSTSRSTPSTGGMRHVSLGLVRKRGSGYKFDVRSPGSRAFPNHKCGRRCINWAPFKKQMVYSLNPLAVCLTCEWHRDRVGNRVIYTSPCGIVCFQLEEILIYLETVSSKMTIDLFDFDPELRLDPLPFDRNRILVLDLSCGSEEVQVPVFNDIDNTKPDRFRYSTDCLRHGEWTPLQVDPQFVLCCECTDNCWDKRKCVCQQMTTKPYENADVGYLYRRLFNKLETEIFECNEGCKCSSTCLNRVAQNPLQIRLQVFKTIDKGWGVRTLYDIPRGTFICTFVGEFLSRNEAKKEGMKHGDHYFLYLNYVNPVDKLRKQLKRRASDSSDDGSDSDDLSPEDLHCGSALPNSRETTSEKKVKGENGSEVSSSSRSSGHSSSSSQEGDDSGDKYVLNCKYRGNVSRFFNYSSTPNMFVQNVLYDQRVHRLAFFSKERINAGDELTWNYGSK